MCFYMLKRYDLLWKEYANVYHEVFSIGRQAKSGRLPLPHPLMNSLKGHRWNI